MREVLFTEQADADLICIYTYSYQNWDEEQAIQYTNQLKKTIQQIATSPSLGKRRNNIRSGYYSYLSGSHVIFYRFTEERLEVVRLLHKNMDFKQHLTDEL